jgi:hypothetical protein
MTLTRLNQFCLVLLLIVGCVLSQKRARPAVADLEMLLNDQSFANREASSGGAGGYDNFVSLAETLKRLQEMEKYYSHLARPRYGRSVDSAADESKLDIRPTAVAPPKLLESPFIKAPFPHYKGSDR